MAYEGFDLCFLNAVTIYDYLKIWFVAKDYRAANGGIMK